MTEWVGCSFPLHMSRIPALQGRHPENQQRGTISSQKSQQVACAYMPLEQYLSAISHCGKVVSPIRFVKFKLDLLQDTWDICLGLAETLPSL